VSALAVLCGACGHSSLNAPRPPARDVETRIVPPRHQPEIPRLIAPPPAYGNKIVLAHADSETSVN
jgi:hypothetical protein